jgi:hypothetical protein
MTTASNTPPQDPQTYIIGTVVTCQCIFANGYDALGAPVYVDPGAVYFKYKPFGLGEVVLTYGVDAALVRISAGIYKVLLDTTGGPVGRWRERWVSTGNGAGAIERYFDVAASALPYP